MMNKLVVVGLGVLLAAGLSVMASAEEKEATVTGEVVDTYCFASMGAKGASHRQCGMTCAKKGIPVGLLENGTNKLYLLLPNKDKGTVPEDVVNKMGEQATITGKTYSAGGAQFLTIGSVK